MEQITIISSKPAKKDKLKELFKFRSLITFLSWKDIIVRYKQTVLGILWAIIQPIVSMIVMTFIFGGVANMPSEKGVPYAVMVYSALLCWNFFSSAFSSTSNSLVSNSNLLKKVYFPRLALPISSVVTAFVDFLISFLVFIFIMIGYRYMPSIKILALPLFIFLAFLLALGFGLFFATMNVKYRDIRYMVPVIIQFGMYISPVAYSSSVIPEKYALLYSLNPLVGILDGFRWCILPNAHLNIYALLISIGFTLVGLVLGIKFFNNFENTFADLI